MIYEKELSDKIIDCAFEVHKTLGYGFLEESMRTVSRLS
jgi:hypothetical protein